MATIKKQGKGYKITVSRGYDISGKQIREHMTWVPEPGMTNRQIEKELERQQVLFEESCQTGRVISCSIRFADFAETWFSDYANGHLRPKTLSRYEKMMERINSGIGHLRLDRLSPNHLISFYKNLAEPGMREDTTYCSKINFKAFLKELRLTKVSLSKQAEVSTTVLNSITQGKRITEESAIKICNALDRKVSELFDPVGADAGLSGKTILHHHRLISSILQTAVRWQVIASNPCDRADPPKAQKTEPRYLDEVEAAKLLELLDRESDFQLATATKLLIFTGFRRGELCGLEWSDIDFESNVIHVRRSSMYLPDRDVFTDETKNATSTRSIKVSETAMDMLHRYRARQAEYRLSLGDMWQGSDRLFTSQEGAPIHPDVLSQKFRDFIRAHELPDVSLHSMRHTNATLQIAAGVNVATVAKRLGHSSPTTTAKIYTHAIQSADAAAAETLDNLLSPSAKAGQLKSS